VIATRAETLHILAREGGPQARIDRYRQNLAVLTEGLAAEGLERFIVTFPFRRGSRAGLKRSTRNSHAWDF